MENEDATVLRTSPYSDSSKILGFLQKSRSLHEADRKWRWFWGVCMVVPCLGSPAIPVTTGIGVVLSDPLHIPTAPLFLRVGE